MRNAIPFQSVPARLVASGPLKRAPRSSPHSWISGRLTVLLNGGARLRPAEPHTNRQETRRLTTAARSRLLVRSDPSREVGRGPTKSRRKSPKPRREESIREPPPPSKQASGQRQITRRKNQNICPPRPSVFGSLVRLLRAACWPAQCSDAAPQWANSDKRGSG